MTEEQNKVKKPKKERQQCPYGFSCKDMMQNRTTIAEHCENLNTCKGAAKAAGLPFDGGENERYRFVVYSNTPSRTRFVEELTLNRMAVTLLKIRGNHQNFSNFNLFENISHIRSLNNTIDETINKLNQDYIPPAQVEVHDYAVKRPPTSDFPKEYSIEEIRQRQQIYWYNKLLAKRAIFNSAHDIETKCKAIHLSKDDDARNIQGRIGIERRNRILKIQNRLKNCVKQLEECIELIESDFDLHNILDRNNSEE